MFKATEYVLHMGVICKLCHAQKGEGTLVKCDKRGFSMKKKLRILRQRGDMSKIYQFRVT